MLTMARYPATPLRPLKFMCAWWRKRPKYSGAAQTWVRRYRSQFTISSNIEVDPLLENLQSGEWWPFQRLGRGCDICSVILEQQRRFCINILQLPQRRSCDVGPVVLQTERGKGWWKKRSGNYTRYFTLNNSTGSRLHCFSTIFMQWTPSCLLHALYAVNTELLTARPCQLSSSLSHPRSLW